MSPSITEIAKTLQLCCFPMTTSMFTQERPPGEMQLLLCREAGLGKTRHRAKAGLCSIWADIGAVAHLVHVRTTK